MQALTIKVLWDQRGKNAFGERKYGKLQKKNDIWTMNWNTGQISTDEVK